MRSFVMAAFAGLTVAWSGSALASADYRASLTLDQGLPRLITGSPVHDGPGTLDGSWTDAGRRQADGTHRDQTGVDASGNATWSALHGGGGGLHNTQGPLNTLGEIIARAPSLDYNASAEAEIGWRSLRAAGQHNGEGAQVNAFATWDRGFTLAAGESFTLTALGSLAILGDAAPLDTNTWFNVDVASTFAALTMADVADRVRASLTATLTSPFSGDLGNVFGFHVGPGGRLSLTVSNTTGSAMTGSLGLGTYVNVSAPIPEAATTAMMLAGLVLVGGVARRRRHHLAR